MLYDLHQFNRAWLDPATQMAQAGARLFSTPETWLSRLPGASHMSAGYELFYRLGKAYEKPTFGIEAVDVQGVRTPVVEEVVLSRPFCSLRRFGLRGSGADHSAVLLVAPLSGHHATLLRDTVRTIVPDHTVYVTDWIDARMVPIEAGPFTLEDYVEYLRQFIRNLGAPRLHVVAVCQAAVPAVAAVSLLASSGEAGPRSLVLMGGPIDTRRNPTSVNRFATSRPLGWFEANLIQTVPGRYPGRGRRVYPGFLQHAGFVAMNPLVHFNSHWDFYRDLVQGNLEAAENHREFYDEYNAVLDMPAEYYLDCIRIVFQEHRLPLGEWHVRGQRVIPAAVSATALMAVEGELDDISGLGQTKAALELTTSIPAERKRHFVARGVGHYGIFSGRRWRQLVYPAVRAFIATADESANRPTRSLSSTGRS